MNMNRVALVTGAGRGIGRAAAIELSRRGARVALTARSVDQLQSVVDEIGSHGGEAVAIAADLAEREAPARILEEVKRRLGPVEILVNNAGVGSSGGPQPLVDFDDEFWNLTMAVNVTAPYLLTKLVLPDMIAAGWGRIINVSSINCKKPAMHAAAYVTSKHAVAGLTKAAALEVADRGITVNAVCPGVTATEMNDKRLEYDSKRLGRTIAELESAASPLGRRILPEEVAALIGFLAEESASGINGQTLNVCGGTINV